jgi:hypothetical protein
MVVVVEVTMMVTEDKGEDGDLREKAVGSVGGVGRIV